MLRVFIMVGKRPDGRHKISVFPEDDSPGGHHRKAHVKRNEWVRWTVRNMTDKKITIKVDNFDDGNGNTDPIDWGDQQVEVRRANQQTGTPGRETLWGKAREDAVSAHPYNYDVLIDGTVVKDPKLRVDN